MSGRSVWPTASDSMLKLRARIRLATRFRTPGRLLTMDRPARGDGPRPFRARALGPAAPSERAVAWRRVAHSSATVPGLDQVGEALAGGHHREDVLRLGDLEPDQRRAIDGLRGAMPASTSSGRAGLEGGDAVGVGQLGAVGPEQRGRVVVAAVDDLLPLPDHAQLLVVEQGDLDRDAVLRPGSSAPGWSSGSRRRRRSPRSPCRAGRGPRPWPPAGRSPSCPGRPS